MNVAVNNYDTVIFLKFNIVVSDCDINFKKITMPQSLTMTLLMFMLIQL